MTDIATALELADAPDLEDDEQRERWKVKSDRAASWALRRLGEAQAEIARLEEAADDEIRALKVWCEAAVTPLKRDINFFEGVLIEYRMALEAEHPELPQTYKVPGGTIARRKTPDKIEIIDADAVVRWAIRSGLFELLKIEPRVSLLKEIGTPVHETGICDTCEASIVKDESGSWVHEDAHTGEILDHPAVPYMDPTGALVIGEGDDIEAIPGVVHLIRGDSYSAKAG